MNFSYKMSETSRLDMTLDRMMVTLDTLNSKLINISEQYDSQKGDIDALILIVKQKEDDLNDFILNQKVVMTELRERITEEKRQQDETIADLKKQIEEIRTLTAKKEEIRECQAKCCKKRNKCCVVM